MRFYMSAVAPAARSFPRTTVVLAFLAISAMAQLQTVVDLHPTRQSQTQIAQTP